MSSSIVLDNTVLSVFKRLGEIGILKKILAVNVVIPTGVLDEYLQIGDLSDLDGFEVVD